MEDTLPKQHPMLRVLSLRDYRLLYIGSVTSILGDQFALIALPWLVLQLTGDPLALGFVLALEGIPRAAFMLLGGAITDRFSPRIIMLASDIIRLILTALIAFLVFTGTAQMWMLYVGGLAFGLVAGFAIPASNSIVPMLVKENELHAGNSLMMGSIQTVNFVGLSAAGIIIGRYNDSSLGIALAFAIDALTFAVSAFNLWLMHGGGQHPSTAELAGKENVWASIWKGMKFMWTNPALRLMFLVVTAANFLLSGPILVGIPVLANQRLPEGALAFGLLMSAYAGGNLVGYLLAGALPRPSGKGMRVFVIALLITFGMVIGSLGILTSTWLDFGLMLLVGMGNGYISIIVFTWMQTRTPKEMLGRVMSMLLLSNIGLVPVSQAISGAVSKWSLTALFASAGILILIVALWVAPQPALKTFSEDITRRDH